MSRPTATPSLPAQAEHQATHPSRSAPKCVDCTHQLALTYPTGLLRVSLCDHPTAEVSPADGLSVVKVLDMRAHGPGRCGPEGTLFTPKPVSCSTCDGTGAHREAFERGLTACPDCLTTPWLLEFDDQLHQQVQAGGVGLENILAHHDSLTAFVQVHGFRVVFPVPGQEPGDGGREPGQSNQKGVDLALARATRQLRDHADRVMFAIKHGVPVSAITQQQVGQEPGVHAAARLGLQDHPRWLLPLILQGDQGSGKTSSALAMAAAALRPLVVDDWYPGLPVLYGALHLTSDGVA